MAVFLMACSDVQTIDVNCNVLFMYMLLKSMDSSVKFKRIDSTVKLSGKTEAYISYRHGPYLFNFFMLPVVLMKYSKN